jgi:hypothetical protein
MPIQAPKKNLALPHNMAADTHVLAACCRTPIARRSLLCYP